MSTRPALGRPPLVIWGLGDSTGCGHLTATVAQPVPYCILRGLEALRRDPARAAYQSPDIPDYRFVGGLTADTAEFQESGRGFSAFLSGSTAEDIRDGTGGQQTPAVAIAAMSVKPDVCILSTAGNDFSSLNRSVATVLATVTSDVTAIHAAAPLCRVIYCAPHRGFNPGAAHYQDVLDLQVAATALATGADQVMTAHHGAAYLDGMMVDSASDAHPKVPASPSVWATWRGPFSPLTNGCHAYAQWLWPLVFRGYAKPILPGETWV